MHCGPMVQLKARGVICREAQNECDIPEYCGGDSGVCPRDIFKKNGNPCGQTKSALGEVLGEISIDCFDLNVLFFF